MNTAIQLILVSFTGILGSIIGLFVNGLAVEELKTNKKTLIYIKNIIFIALTFILFFTLLGILYSSIITIITGILLFGPKKNKTVNQLINFIPVGYITAYLFYQSIGAEYVFIEAFITSIGLLGIFYMIDTGILFSEQQKIIEKGIWKKETWKKLIQENKAVISMPIIIIIFVSFFL